LRGALINDYVKLVERVFIHVRSLFWFGSLLTEWLLWTYSKNKPLGREKFFWVGSLKCLTARGGEWCLEVLGECKCV
jgi:hypothetical protein